jgi:hypothetical protein
MNLVGQKGNHHGGMLVRVIEYQADDGEVIRLLTDLMDARWRLRGAGLSP